MLTALSLASSLWVLSQDAGERAVRLGMACHGSGDTAVCAIPDGVPPFVPVELVADDFGRDLYWLIGSNAADLYSTAWAIHRCGGECGEGNPFGPTAEARIALKLASTASTGLTLWKLRRDGHGRTATIMRWVAVGINVGLVVNNARHAIRKR